MPFGGGPGGQRHRAWWPVALASVLATVAAAMGQLAAGAGPTKPTSTQAAFHRAPQLSRLDHRPGTTRTHFSLALSQFAGRSHRRLTPALSPLHPGTITVAGRRTGAGGMARGGAGTGPGGERRSLGAAPLTASALPSLGRPEQPRAASTAAVAYSPAPLATEPSTPCLPASKSRVECEMISAPRSSVLSGIELEGSGREGGLTPQELRSAYKLPEHGGSGATIAVVDGPADPNAEIDLNAYRKEYGLGECTAANNCFKQMNSLGEVKKPTEPRSWNTEISLDLDMVSAACPECHIVLVEAIEAGPSYMLAAEEEAAKLGVTAITNSWNIGFELNNPANSKVNCEERRCVSAEEEAADEHYFNHPGTPIFFAGGDYGYAVRYPAASPYVIAVGGTTLKKEAGSSRGWAEETWFNSSVEADADGRGGGSGCSLYATKPKWQTDKACTKRLLSDVAADADWEKSPVSVYDSYVPGGWFNSGGTSLSSPLVAGTWALSTSYTKNLGNLGAEAFYKSSGALFDLTTGSNGTCSPPTEDEYWCTAKVGFDGPGGNGTPDGALQLNRAPSVTTKAATGISAAAGTLNGTVDPNGLETTYQFEYGKTTSYGTDAPASPASAGATWTSQEVRSVLTGLQPETTYHYRLAATNGFGSDARNR